MHKKKVLKTLLGFPRKKNIIFKLIFMQKKKKKK